MAKHRRPVADAPPRAVDRDETEPLAGSILTVSIDDIVVDPQLQMRAAPHTAAYLKQMIEAVEARSLRNPVVLFQDPVTGAMLLADGLARVEAHRRAGAGDVPADVRVGDRREAFRFALGANAKHGARRNNRDLHKAVTAALADPEIATYSNTVIAELCACSDTFVGNVRNAAGGSNGSNPTKRVGKDGRLQAAKKTGRVPSATNHEPDAEGQPESSGATHTIDLTAVFREAATACGHIRRALDSKTSLGSDGTKGPASLDTTFEAIRTLRDELNGVLAHLARASTVDGHVSVPELATERSHGNAEEALS